MSRQIFNSLDIDSYDNYMKARMPNAFDTFHNHDILTEIEIPTWYAFERALMMHKLSQCAQARQQLVRVVMRLAKDIQRLEQRITYLEQNA